MPEFVDEKGALEWAQNKSSRAVRVFAARSALRGLPALFTFKGDMDEREVLFVFRAMFSAWTAACALEIGRDLLIALDRAADKSTRYSVFASRACEAATHQHNGDRLAAENIHSFYPASRDQSPTRDAHAAASIDSDNISSDIDAALFEPLWPNQKMPNGLILMWQNAKAAFSRTDGEWNFWHQWFDSILEGKPKFFELQRRVALIPDADWEQGPAHIAEKIEEIKAAFLAEKTPLAETVEFNEATAKFYTKPIEVSGPELFETTLERAEFAVSLALGGNNGLQASSYEVLILRHTLDHCRSDPQTVEMNFMQVSGSLRRQMECGEYPESPELTGLTDTLTQGALDIRATHPEVAEARAKRAEQAVQEADPETKAALAEALPVLVAVSNPKLATEFEQDVAQLLNTSVGPPIDGAPSVGPADATMRIGNRVAGMSLLAKSSDVVKTIDGSGGYKALRIVGTIRSLVTWIARLLGYPI